MVDGLSLLRSLRELLNESSTSEFLDTRSSYEFLWQAAIEFVDRTNCLRNEQSITTVADQAGYTLNANFLKLYLKDSSNKFYLKYDDDSTEHFVNHRDYEDVIFGNQTTSQSIPNYFSIIDDSTKDTQLSSTTTSVGASSGGQATLTDSTADFADVSAGDIVHNTTDGSDGVVLSKTSSTALVTALFGGTDDDYTSGDSYVIQPQARFKLIFDPPPSTASHTATLYYIERPAPVFSDYGIYRISSTYLNDLVEYAAFKYKYRDREPGFGDKFFQHWDRKVRHSGHSLNQAFLRRGFKVNLRVRKWIKNV